MDLENWLQLLVSAAKYCCSLFLRKTYRLSEFYSLLVVEWVYYKFVTLIGIAYGEDYVFEFCGRACSEV